MTRRPVPSASLVAGLVLAWVIGGSAGLAGADASELERARRVFLERRDVAALNSVLAQLAPTTADEQVDRQLALLAAGTATPAPSGAARGYAAVPEIVTYLRRLELGRAEAATARLGRAPLPGGLDTWLAALLDVRRGRDDAARDRLLAWQPSGQDPEREAFRLALLGAALPDDDRHLVAGAGREALLEAAAAGGFGVVAHLAEALVALDPGVGGDGLCLALRALRRSGHAAEADRLLSRPAAASAETHACFRLERALDAAWRGRPAEIAPRLTGLEVSPPLDALVEALADTRGFTIPPAVGAVEVPFAERHAHALAALATRLGRPTPASEVEAAAVAQGAAASDGAFASRFLADRGFAVLSVAGGGETALRAADAGIPFLLRSIQLEGDVFRDEPVLVLGRDAPSGLWLTSPGDIERLDVLPADAVAKARLLLALPRARATELATWPVAGEREAGALLDAATVLAQAGRVDEAARALAPGTPGGASPVLSLYRAFFEHGRHLELLEEGRTEEAAAALVRVGEALQASMAHPPRSVFELLASYQALYATGRRDAAVDTLEAASRAAPGSSYLPLTLFAVCQREGRRRDALAALDQALAAAPLDTSLLYYRGTARRALGRNDAALGDLVRALDRRPDWVPVGLELAHLLLGLRRADAALAVLDDLQRRVPSLAQEDAALVLRREAEHRQVQAARSIDDLSALLVSSAGETRRLAAYRLADFELDASEARLRALLEDPDPAVRVTVLRVYMRPWLRSRAEGDAALTARLIRVLREDASPLARGAAVGLLSRVDRPEVVEPLADALAGPHADASVSVRAEVASVLARRDGPRSRAALVAALADVDTSVRRAAIDALLQLAGTYRGFDPEGPPEERARAVAAWRAWLGT